MGRSEEGRPSQMLGQSGGAVSSVGAVADLPFWRLMEGDALARLREIADDSVHCAITSPPYYGLRDYDHDDQIGVEETIADYVQALVAVFEEVRRVLRPDGTFWLNIGDGFAGNGGARTYTGLRAGRGDEPARPEHIDPAKHARWRRDYGGAKPKDLIGVPWLLAFALRDAGWWLRQEIIWSKRSAMPDPTTDRCTRSHEQVFMLAKSRRYFYDADAIAEDAISTKGSGNGYQRPHALSRDQRGQPHPWQNVGGKRNKRTVWTLGNQPFKSERYGLDVKHNATFPPKLIEPCILAGTAERCCSECGAPWISQSGSGPGLDMDRPQARRAVELADEHGLTDDHIAAIRACGVSDTGRARETQTGVGHNLDEVQALADEAKAALGGYYREFLLAKEIPDPPEPSCDHGEASSPAVVLDPFSGAGTTIMTALRLGRSAIGVELNPDYVELARRRIHDDAPLMNTTSEVTDAALAA